VFKVLMAACINPVVHYNLDVGLLREGNPADFIVVNNLQEFGVKKTYIGGTLVAENGVTTIKPVVNRTLNNFHGSPLPSSAYSVTAKGKNIRVIEALDGQLITRSIVVPSSIEAGFAISDVSRDILKIAVVNRYSESKPSMGFIRNFGLKNGAIASSVSHDSHNIIAIGADDEAISHVVNLIIRARGGIAAVDVTREMILPLPVAGIMSEKDGYEVSKSYQAIDKMAKSMGSTLGAPFMTLSFMALLVIPSLKISDKGLFDCEKFQFVELFSD
jgi:adenine deaminase